AYEMLPGLEFRRVLFRSERAAGLERELLRGREDESKNSALLAYLSLAAAAVLGLGLLGVAYYLVRRDRAGRERAAAERAALLARAPQRVVSGRRGDRRSR